MIERGHKVDILDHGFVTLIDYMGNDNSSLIAARMSTGNPTGVDETKDDKLRKRLWEESHTSPTEMAEVVFEVQLPLFCLRQLDRHRTLDYSTDQPVETVDESFRKFMNRNEFSGRYSGFPDVFYIPDLNRISGANFSNKQGSGGELDIEVRKTALETISNITKISFEHYQSLRQLGVANELARIILPNNQYTKIQLKGDLLSWLRFANLRVREDVQWETRQFAIEILSQVEQLFPKSVAVFKEHTLGAVTLSKTEKETIAELLKGCPALTSNVMRKLGLI